MVMMERSFFCRNYFLLYYNWPKSGISKFRGDLSAVKKHYATKYTTDTYIKFCFWFGQSGVVCTIHEEDDAIDGREVVFPHSAGCVNKRKTQEFELASLHVLVGENDLFVWKTATISILAVKVSSVLHYHRLWPTKPKVTGFQNTHTHTPCAWPPRSKVVKVMPAIVSSSEAGEKKMIMNKSGKSGSSEVTNTRIY